MDTLPQARPKVAFPHNFSPLRAVASAGARGTGADRSAIRQQTFVQEPKLVSEDPSLTPIAANSFTGFLQDDNGNLCGDGASGPYVALAVSPKYVVQLVNDCFSIYDKKGILQPGYPKTLAAFFGVTVVGGNERIFYDWVANRFVIGAVSTVGSGNTASGLALIAASASSDPTGNWHIYELPVGGGGQTPNYPALGHNHYGDRFSGDIALSYIFDTVLLGNQTLFLPKAQVYAGAGFGYNYVFNLALNGVLVQALQPANVSSPNDEPRAQFAVQSLTGDNCSPTTCNGLGVWAFSNVLQNPGSPGPDFSVVVIPTPSNFFPPTLLSQIGGTPLELLAGSEVRSAVQYAAGSLFATLNTDNGGGSGIRAYQFHPYLDDNGDGHCSGAFLNACPRIVGGTIEQELSYFTGAGSNYSAFNGAIQPNPERNFTMVFNFMDAFSIYPSTAYISNRVTQTPGLWRDSGYFLNPLGSGAYTYGNYGIGFWGEWNATALDNSTHPPAVWFTGAYSRADGTWGTTIGKTGYTVSSQP